MRLHNIGDVDESESRSSAFRGKVGGENLCKLISGNSLAVVSDGEFNVAAK